MEYDPEGSKFDGELRDHVPGLFERVNNYLLLLYAVACFLMYFSISGLLALRGSVILALIAPAIIAFILPMFLLSRRFSLSFTREYSLETPGFVTSLLVLIVAAGSILPVDAVSSILERRYPPDADYISFLLSIKPKGLVAFIATAFATVVVTPFGEELLFRGFVQRIFQRNMPRLLAVALASVVFALSHFNLPLLPGITILGLMLGYIFSRTGNLVYPVMAHALYNLVSLVRLDLMPESAIRSAEIESPSAFWTIVSVFGLAAGVALLERHHSSPPRQ